MSINNDNISNENKPEIPEAAAAIPRLTINSWLDSQGIITYNTIESAPLTNSVVDTDTYFTADTKEYDLIELEEINVYNYLKKTLDNIIIIYLKNIYFVSKSRLKKLCYDTASVKYKCNAITSNNSNYVKTVPYLTGRSFGCLCELIEISKIKTIINTPEIRVVEITNFIPKQNAVSTISLGVILAYLGHSRSRDRLTAAERTIVSSQNIVSASHCQEGQNEKIQDIQILATPTAIMASGKPRARTRAVSPTEPPPRIQQPRPRAITRAVSPTEPPPPRNLRGETGRGKKLRITSKSKKSKKSK